MLNNQKENKEFLGKEEMRADFARKEGAPSNTEIAPLSLIQSSEDEARHIPQRLAAKMSGATLNLNYQPTSNYMGYDAAMKAIQGTHSQLSAPVSYRYNQHTEGCFCAKAALATALSIRDKKQWKPSDVKEDEYGLTWTEDGVKSFVTKYYSDLTKTEVLLAIDAQLQMGHPVLVQVRKDNGTNMDVLAQHWATVIAKTKTTGSYGERYKVIDPDTGTIVVMNQMAYYEPSNDNITGYAIVSEALS